MGFRSMITSEDYNIIWPHWFVCKYHPAIHFNKTLKGALVTHHEVKLYGNVFFELPEDIQKAIDWDQFGETFRFILIMLHECGGVTRLHVSRNSIRWSEPAYWTETDGVSHHYCLDCAVLPDKPVQKVIPDHG